MFVLQMLNHEWKSLTNESMPSLDELRPTEKKTVNPELWKRSDKITGGSENWLTAIPTSLPTRWLLFKIFFTIFNLTSFPEKTGSLYHHT